MSRNAIRSRRGQLDKLREEVRQGIFRETDERHSRKMKVCYLKPGEVTPPEYRDIPNIVQTKYPEELRSVAWSLWEIYNSGRFESQYLVLDLRHYDVLFIRKHGDELSTIEILLDEVDRYIQQRMEKGILPPFYYLR